MVRILYLGSPSFAVYPLEALVQAGYTICAVVTQPDRPAGRQRTLTAPPVKLAAQRLGLQVLQPPTLRDPAVIEQLAALRPNVGVVAAYGEILRKAVLEIPPLGYLNIHPSLLPLHRGPTPVAGAILAGDTETGMTIMKLDRGMDSGPILAQVIVPLSASARAEALTDELFQLGAKLLLDVLPSYVNGAIELRPQDHSQASVTRLLTKEDGLVDWTLPALVIERRIRAFDPWPGAHTIWRGQNLKLLYAQVDATWSGDECPGTIVSADGPRIATGSGALILNEVQPSGRRSMSGQAWVHGQPGLVGQRLGA
ncbi:MAG: methionyl-tRNA formyltransferase [Chloroflexales bacterium]|nr:methionyl-tRNA formyltransferase [Chloroflexales bacterium]